MVFSFFFFCFLQVLLEYKDLGHHQLEHLDEQEVFHGLTAMEPCGFLVEAHLQVN
jgi:hypothetical protein